jgi:thiamine phosphate synthase YjbQ (UPF0047 family)
MIPVDETCTEDWMEEITVKTSRQIEMIDITSKVNQRIKEGGIKEGICLIFCPHTTAGITINENADPNVVRDILSGLDRLIPEDRPYLHAEGNSCSYQIQYHRVFHNDHHRGRQVIPGNLAIPFLL